MAIHLLGTSHIAEQSQQQVRAAISTGRYAVIALELDRQRLHAVMSGDQQRAPFLELVRIVGVSGALFAKIAQWAQRRLGARVGVLPGAEMRAAVEAAAHKNVKIALIDQPIQVTLKRFSKAFTWREKLRLAKSVFSVKRMELDITTVPEREVVRELIAEMDRRVPALSKVLIHERNTYMARRLLALQDKHPDGDILAVVGAGHVPGMTEFLNNARREKTLDDQA